MDKSFVDSPEEWRYMVRVYAIIVNDKNEVLLSDEFFKDMFMTKFPGGGLEFGEGTLECLHREAMEEFGQEIEIIRHYYTTDFFQPSLFHEKTQLISIYYSARFKNSIQFTVSQTAFDNTTNKNGSISFRWKSLTDISENDVSFPVDKHVVKLLNQHGCN